MTEPAGVKTLENVVIVLPTYNERENLAPLLDAILSRTARIDGINLSILVVDDLSPDGTGQIAKQYSDRDARVHLLTGARRRGLGTAYKRGLQYAIHTLRADVVFQIDADLSHDPNDIPRLLASARDGTDFVIGSRYVPGGAIPDNWSALRRAMSRWGNVFARHIAGLREVKDCTSGYRAIRVSLLKRMDLNRLADTGYAFLMSLLHEAVKSGATVREIPIRFTDRRHGESKLGMADIAEFLVKVFLIRLSSHRPSWRGVMPSRTDSTTRRQAAAEDLR